MKMSLKTRVIALIDMDCFYCQVEEKLNPSLQGKPVAVVQYNLWRDGGLIAANYLAKAKGVTKGMWMHEAKDLCPEIEFARVAELRGRADLTKYREAGKQVCDVLSTFTNMLERASVDEAYLDLTEAVNIELRKGVANIPLEKIRTTHIVGCETSDFINNISNNQDTDGFCEDDLRLAIGGVIVEKIRAEVLEKTGYKCSAGISHNKILAKLVCGLHKPNKQTILPQSAIPAYFSELPLKKIKRLGGKFGKRVAEELSIQYVGDLLKFSESELSKKFDKKTGIWLYNIARGIDNEAVCPKLISKSISCCKRFPGKNALFKNKDVEHWMNELALEISERLEKDLEENCRKAKMMTISFTQEVNKSDVSSSKTCPLRSYERSRIAQDALGVIRKNCQRASGTYHVKYLGISVGHFETVKKTRDLTYFLGNSQRRVEGKKGDLSGNGDRECTESGEVFESELSPIDTNKEEVFKPNISLNDTNKEEVFKRDISLNDTSEKEFFVSNFSLNDTIKEEAFKSDFSLKDTTLNTVHRASPDLFQDEDENSVPEVQEKPRNQNSFFTNYFEKLKKERHKLDESNIPDNNSIEESVECPPEICYQKCEECGEDVKVEEIVSHMDYHLAFRLQNEVSTGIESVVKKRKLTIVGSTSIESFLEKSPVKIMEQTETCQECNKQIKLSELESHSDYHAARRLNRELNFRDTGRNNSKGKELGCDISRYLKRKSY